MMEQEHPHKSVALIVGVTGMAGQGLAEALKSPKALGGPWEVYGTALRPKPTWFPSTITDHFISFDATNRKDTIEKLSPIAKQVTHLFWVALHVSQTEELNIEINSMMLFNVLNALLHSTPSSPLRHVSLQTGTKHYMGPFLDPSFHGRMIPQDPPFLEDLPRLPYPNFYYSLEDLLMRYSKSFTYSVHRASSIIGASTRSVYNLLLTLCVYATICKHKGLVFRYPGTKYTWEHFCDASDVRVLAEQHIWAAVTERAQNEAFNCTNGDVFTWKCFWKVLCEIFGVEYVEIDESGEKFHFVEEMNKKGKVWDTIVQKYGLYETKLDEITCFEAVNLVLNFGFQHVSSMNKSREFGFFGHVDTLKSIKMWVERLREMKFIP